MKNVTTGENAQTSETTRAPAMARKTMLVLTAVLALGSTANLNAGDYENRFGYDIEPSILIPIGLMFGVAVTKRFSTPVQVLAGLTGASVLTSTNPNVRDKSVKAYNAYKAYKKGPSEKSKRIAAERRLANEGK